MKRIYLIAPLLLVALFAGVYFNKRAELAEKARIEAEAKTATEKAEAVKKAEADRKAREDAEVRAKARVEEEKKKEADRLAKRDAELRGIADETKRLADEAAALATKVAEGEKKLKEIREARTAQADATFAAEREVEQGAVARRNAELEVQRLTEVLARRVTGTPLTPTAGLVASGR